MGKRGPKAWEPTADERSKVRLYAGLGMTQEQIGHLLGKSVDSLDRYCRDDLDAGKAEIIAKVAGSLVKKAMGGDTASAIFYLKTQARWKETSVQEHTGAGGGAIQIEQVSADADDFTRRIAGLASRGGEAGRTSETEH